jgi:hypothetical protein
MKYTRKQWNAHYARRARGCLADAENARARGNNVEAAKLLKIASLYHGLIRPELEPTT